MLAMLPRAERIHVHPDTTAEAADFVKQDAKVVGLGMEVTVMSVSLAWPIAEKSPHTELTAERANDVCICPLC